MPLGIKDTTEYSIFEILWQKKTAFQLNERLLLENIIGAYAL